MATTIPSVHLPTITCLSLPVNVKVKGKPPCWDTPTARAWIKAIFLFGFCLGQFGAVTWTGLEAPPPDPHLLHPGTEACLAHCVPSLTGDPGIPGWVQLLCSGYCPWAYSKDAIFILWVLFWFCLVAGFCLTLVLTGHSQSNSQSLLKIPADYMLYHYGDNAIHYLHKWHNFISNDNLELQCPLWDIWDLPKLVQLWSALNSWGSRTQQSAYFAWFKEGEKSEHVCNLSQTV